MAFRPGCLLLWAVALGTIPLFAAATCDGEAARPFVQQAVQNELAKDRDDHTRWIYFEVDRKDDHTVKQWVAETRDGSLRRVLEANGQAVPEAEQRRRMDNYVGDTWARSKQRKSEQHDDQQAAEMLNLLPQAFNWTNQGTKGSLTLLHFTPNPDFRPPDLEARVFASMEGDMAVDTQQLRIASIKGRLIRDVLIGGGFLGRLNAGGTFNIERRETGNQIWQITETHVHIQGHALLFKTISEQEDDVKSEFKQLTNNPSLQQAEAELLALKK
ncbi:MAG TPA: hypothetical protein VGL00_23195 [Terracidiphilus sp.]|jgi:hypothetical protein